MIHLLIKSITINHLQSTTNKASNVEIIFDTSYNCNMSAFEFQLKSRRQNNCRGGS